MSIGGPIAGGPIAGGPIAGGGTAANTTPVVAIAIPAFARVNNLRFMPLEDEWMPANRRSIGFVPIMSHARRRVLFVVT